MHTDRPSPPDENLAVRLQWPTDPLRTPPARSESAAPDGGQAPTVHTAEVVPNEETGGPRHALIAAYDRLGDRVLERMRSLREDVDADLAAVRSELASLRQAVDDVGDRVQLRQLRATIDELRGDVSGLRRAVLEWPELQQVSSDIAGLRSDMSSVLEGLRDGGAASPSRDDQGGALPLPALVPLVEEVAALRGEVASLRRRITLRAGIPDAGVDEVQLDRLAGQVAERIAPTTRSATRSRRR